MSTKDTENKAEIENLCATYEIPYLVHFTRIENLKSIMKKGLLSRVKVDAEIDEAITNDENRLDGRRHTISLSIAHPNDRMFTKYREDPEQWCVLGIRKEILWELDCLFFKHNAADIRVSGKPDNELRTSDSLSSLYTEIEGHESRESQHLSKFDPTDKQAEILVCDEIPPKYIFAIAVTSRQVKKNYQEAADGRPIHIHPPGKNLFASRTYRRKFT